MERSQLIQFVGQIEAAVPDMGVRNKVATAAIAMAIAYTRHLPSVSVESPNGYFIEQVGPQSCWLISQFNEEIVIDTEATHELVRKFWLARYRVAYPTGVPIYHPDFTFNTIMAGFAGQFSEVEIEFLSIWTKEIMTLAATASAIVDQAKAV